MSRGPTIAVVTPCLNQAPYVDATLRSVLDGIEPPDEYVVVDGGSSDGSIKLIERHSNRLSWWVSEADDGQYAAIDKGFKHTSGEVMAWLNGGDLFMPWTLSLVREVFHRFPEIQWLTSQRPLIVDDHDHVVSCEFIGGFARRSFEAGVNLPGGDWFSRAGIQQESTFWRRNLWERAGGGLSPTLQYAGDFELWQRFFEHAEPYSLDAPLGAHRVHAGQKTQDLDRYVAEARGVLGTRDAAALQQRARRWTYNVLGRRPLRRLPVTIAGPLVHFGLLHRTRTVVWHEGDWKITRDYAV
jgi:glycosyltransferase involved in cell wall biosynthesis